MTEKAQRKVENLQQRYEDAVTAYADDPNDDTHQATIDTAQKLADARQDMRVDEVKRGVRTEGMGVTAEQNSEDA